MQYREYSLLVFGRGGKAEQRGSVNVEQIAQLAAAGESETLEFKETTGTRREAAMTVCAMLNQNGGQVLFGIAPDGTVAGQTVSERTLEEISSELGRMDPQAFPAVRRMPLHNGREVIVVSVGSGPAKPYRYRSTAYRRVGNTTLPMGTEEYNRVLFERLHADQRWENQPAVGWSIKDLDIAEIRNTVAEAVRIGRLNEPGTGIRKACCAALACSVTEFCFVRGPYSLAVRSVLNLKCRNACFESRAFGGLIERNFSTIGSSMVMHSRFCPMPSVSCAIRCR